MSSSSSVAVGADSQTAHKRSDILDQLLAQGARNPFLRIACLMLMMLSFAGEVVGYFERAAPVARSSLMTELVLDDGVLGDVGWAVLLA